MTELTITIHDWSTTGSEYDAPEVRRVRLQGRVFGHPRKAEGERVVTSHIIGVRGRLVQTASGSTYRLGRISSTFRAWLREQGRPYDSRQPIKWVKRT